MAVNIICQTKSLVLPCLTHDGDINVNKLVGRFEKIKKIGGLKRG